MNLKEACPTLKILNSARGDSLEKLISFGVLKKYEKGEHLFFDRENVDYLYFIVQGKAALYKLNNNHEKKVILVYGNGELLNEVMLQDVTASINCEFLSDTVVAMFCKKKFIAVMESDFGLTKAVIDSMALKIRRLYHQMKNTSNSVRLDKQIAAKLWKLSLDHGIKCKDGIMIDFDLTITYLADMVGSKRETVSRQLKILIEKKIIIISKSRFIVTDRELLLKYFEQM